MKNYSTSNQLGLFTQLELFAPRAPPPERNNETFLQDLLSQDPNRPIRPKTEKLSRWVRESCAYYNAKAECLSFSHEHARTIRRVWLDLMIEAHDLEDTPVTLLYQAAEPYIGTKP